MALQHHPLTVPFKPTGPRGRSLDSLYALMTPAERNQLRGNTNAVQDCKEGLDRQSVIYGDKRTKALLLESGIFDADRIDELLS